MKWLWTSGERGKNPKTGPIPTAYPAEEGVAWESCAGCPLREGKRRPQRDPERPQCYYWYGLGSIGVLNMQEAANNGKDYSLTTALKDRRMDTRAVRMSGGGDPSATDHEQYFDMEDTVRGEGLRWLDYTHFWQSKGAWLKGHALASCETWEQARQAVSEGWRAAVHVPHIELTHGKTEDGYTWLLCPQQQRAGVTCNECRLCDATAVQKPQIIVFRNH